MPLSLNQFLNMLESSLRHFVDNESRLIDRRVNEVCINHKFANSIEYVFKNNLPWVTIDLEYDKNLDDKKYIPSNEGNISIRPDILVHRREDNSRNLIAFECKKSYLNVNDIFKLCGLLREPYCYQYTCGISYLPGKDYMRIKLFCNEDLLLFQYDKLQRNLLPLNERPRIG